MDTSGGEQVVEYEDPIIGLKRIQLAFDCVLYENKVNSL